MNFKNALVAGTGKSGISAAKLLIAHGVKVTLFDENEKRDKNDSMYLKKYLTIFKELRYYKPC